MDVKETLKSIEGYDDAVKKALKSTLELEKRIKATQNAFLMLEKGIKAVSKQLSSLSNKEINIKINMSKNQLKKVKPQEISIKVKDSATASLNKIRKSLSFTRKTYAIRINVNKDALSYIGKVQKSSSILGKVQKSRSYKGKVGKNSAFMGKASTKTRTGLSGTTKAAKIPSGPGLSSIGALGGIKGMLLGALADFALKALSVIKDKISNGIDIIMSKTAEKLKSTSQWKKISEQIMVIKKVGEEVLGSVVNMLATMGMVMLNILNGPLSRFAEWFKGKQSGVKEFTEKLSSNFDKLTPTIDAAVNRIANAMGNFGRLFANATGGTESFVISIASIGNVITSVGNTIATIIEFLAPVLGGVWSLIRVMLSTIMTNIPVVLDVFGSIFTLIGPMIQDIVGILQVYLQVWSFVFTAQMSIIKTVWTIIGPLLKAVWDIIMIIVDVFKILWAVSQPVIRSIMEELKPLADFISWIFEKLSGLTSKLGGLTGALRSFVGKKAEESMAENGVTNTIFPKSHAFGLARVPYDNYPALLHEGERVLTKQESNSMGGSVTIPKLADTIVVREQADIDKIADALSKRLLQYSLNMGVA